VGATARFAACWSFTARNLATVTIHDIGPGSHITIQPSPG
jgi:hypothetical protein